MGADPAPWQIKALLDVAKNDRVAIRSAHGTGKSTWLSWLILWFLLTRFPARIPCTAPTRHQLDDILWGEISKWYRKLDPDIAALIAIKSGRVELVDAPNESFAVARTSRRDQPEALQGQHSENMLFVIDEASGVPDSIFEVGEGALSTPGAKTLLTGNPTRTHGYFYDTFHKAKAYWSTHQVAFSDVSALPYVKASYATEMADRYGKESNIYRVRVLGEFPKSEDDVVIPLAMCEAAVGRDVEQVTGYRPVWGLYVPRRSGERAALSKRCRNVLLESPKWWRGKTGPELAAIIQDEYEKMADDEDLKSLTPDYESQLPAEILVDGLGLGPDIVSRLRAEGLPARGINMAEAGPTLTDGYAKRRDELWWKARAWYEAQDCLLPDCPELLAELSYPQYEFGRTGKIKIEEFDEMKKRGTMTTELGESFVLTMAGGNQKTERHTSSRYGGKKLRHRRPSSAWAA